jgi:hypothetical protein
MSVKVNFIVAKTNPNLYAAAKAANLPQDQVSQLEQFSWTVDKNKKLNQLSTDAARKEYNELDPEIQNKLKYLYPKADYMQAPPDASDYAFGALKTAAKIVASPLIGIFKAAGAYNRVINTPYLVARQASQGEGLFSMQTWTDAWDGRRIFDHGALAETINTFGDERVEVAKGFLAGKTPGEIIAASGGTVNQKLLDALEESLNNPDEFKQVMDGVKYAQVSPGRDIARSFFSKNPNSSTVTGDYIDGKTKDVSGKIDFFYQLAIDPLTWLTGGLSTAARAGTRAAQTMKRFPNATGVKMVFDDEKNGVRKLWDDQLGPKVSNLIDAKKAGDRVAVKTITDDIKLNHPAYNNDAAIEMLQENKIVNAASAIDYFSQAEKLPYFMAGRVDGIQYSRNGIATANTHRKFAAGISKLTEKFINPRIFDTPEEALKASDDAWDSLLKQSPENASIGPEATDLKKFHDSLTLKQKIQVGLSRQLTRSPQNAVIKLGADAVETANAFRLTARQVMPKDMADFMTQKFVTSTQNDQISIMKAIDYAIIERYGITGVPGGKDLAMEIINTKYGVSNAMDEIAELAVRPDVAQILSKDTIVYRDGVAYKKTGSVIQPFQETNAVAALDYFMLSEYAFQAKRKKNFLLGIQGSTSSKLATELVNSWSLFTLFPRLGIRSAIDESMMYILTAPAKNIMDVFVPEFLKGRVGIGRKGSIASNIASSYSGSKSGEKLRQALANKLGYKSPAEALDIQARENALIEYAKKKGLADTGELTSSQRKYAQALAATDIYNNRLFGKLDQDEKDYLIQALALNSQYLGSATRSITSASNITGKQAPEVAEEFLDMNQFDRLLKSLQENFKVQGALKGKDVDVSKLVRDGVLNGMGVGVIHFENFVKRFYGNRKNIYGTLQTYNFNPATVFLNNNALRDTSDWNRARNQLLAKVGVERNVEGVFDDVTQQAMDELQGKFLYSIRDKKALDSFLQSRGYTNTRRSEGVDDIDIARDLVEQILADTYRYFHGDSQKYNQALVDTIKAKHSQIVKDSTDFVPGAWREAAKAVTYDEFTELTKGFQPSGKMYTSLEIEGLDDFGNLYTRFGNKAMEVMDRQVTGIIRQPATMVTYLRLRKFYAQAEKEYTDDLLKQIEAEAIQSGKSFNKVDAYQIAEVQAQKYFSEVSIQQAADEVLKFVDNPTIRSNFAVSARNVGRYYRATEDFWRRIYRLKDVAPQVLYRTRLAHLGLDASGGVYEDQNGDPYIMMPMDDIIFKTVDSAVRALTPGESGFGQPIFNDFTMKLKLANPSFTPDAGLPTLSGPIGALSVLAMKNVLGQVGGTAGVKAGEELDNFALGSIGDNIDVVRALVPSSLLKLYSILPQNEKSRQEATAAMQAIAYNASQGYMLDPNATDQEKFTYLKNIRLSAHNIVVMRSILGLISPVAPSMQESIDVPSYLKEVGITGLRPEFFDILNAVTQKYKGDIQDPYELAVATFIGQNPGKLIYTVSRDDKKTNVIINKTKELKNWAIENNDNIKAYGESAFIFAPNTGDFDVSTYAWLEGAGLLGNKDLETYYRDVLVSKDKQAYYDIAKDEKAFLATSGDTMLRKAMIANSTRKRNALKASNPLLQAALTGGGNEVGSELAMLTSVEQILIDNKISVDAGTKQRMAMVTSRLRQFVSLANDPSKRELSNFSEIKREMKEDIKALIDDLQTGDPILKEANRAVFRAILDFYSRDTYTARERF